MVELKKIIIVVVNSMLLKPSTAYWKIVNGVETINTLFLKKENLKEVG